MKTQTALMGVVIAGGIFLAGCAKSPDSIAASYISETGYAALNCTQLEGEKQNLAAAYARTAAQQEKARSNDIVGVIFIGLPVSSLSGDNVAPEIARLKGEQEAVRRTMVRKKCAGT